MAYKYPAAQRFFANLAATYSLGEVQKLLTASVGFLDLGIVKIEAEHMVPSFDRLIAILE